MRGPDSILFYSIPTGGYILYWIFLFSRCKASDANIDIIVNVVYKIGENPDCLCMNA